MGFKPALIGILWSGLFLESGKVPLKAAGTTSRFGSEFLVNLRWGVTLRLVLHFMVAARASLSFSYPQYPASRQYALPFHGKREFGHWG